MVVIFQLSSVKILFLVEITILNTGHSLRMSHF